MKSLAVAFFLKGRIETTEAKAKELRPYVERLISMGKNPTISNRRLISARVSPKIEKRIVEVGEKMKSRSGGYTRIIKTGVRKSDSSRRAMIELVE
jgi:large subunit ribosomal protein L17